MKLEYKLAETAEEFEAIHKLNYLTFVEEIPQHERNPEGKLVDKFHLENTYFICKNGSQLVAMIAGRTQRPFSLDIKIEGLDSLLPLNSQPVEVRLLAVDPSYRKTKVCGILIEKLSTHYAGQGQDIALISATLREARLYRRMGFVSFGPTVGTTCAQYQPMYLTLKKYLSLATMLNNIKTSKHKKLNLHPGPVEISENVSNALSLEPISHRSACFLDLYEHTIAKICEQTAMPEAYIVQGSGTLANDLVAGQIQQLQKRGVILVNGEFGERLAEQARRWGLEFELLKVDWGQQFDLPEIEKVLTSGKALGWLWFVGLETSTGVKNPYRKLLNLCLSYDVKCCIDAISLLGSEETNFDGAYLVSGSSGKGIGSYSGLAFVAREHGEFLNNRMLPAYLDLSLYAQRGGIPFTLSSNLLRAFNNALTTTDWQSKYQIIAEASAYLFSRLKALGITVVAENNDNLSCIFTIAIPSDIDIIELADSLLDKGYSLYYEPKYLVSRHWMQICLYSLEEVADIYNLPLFLQTQCVSNTLVKS
ncbi:aminotransferase class V-fold PLP-dependent enzyme [Psychrosphaera sp. 1_MG-2023]|uniref:GNAT family N-acetyltransferase n=1 Tax=Psychrosphaera sp. 1_MG-2023 TaxID=3062643 RepID=UPI0026E2F99E|nr:GNAT family N-acetyltransferase [Psychrosphaera sp. 1_MG-2023]MDO6720693.1 aminotransferase class V-fold PLP-dependent enzyme [Psychrosphaera sp. 1_MG-2023]